MKVKTLSAMTEKGLDKKVNEFLYENHQLEIIDIKFSYGDTCSADHLQRLKEALHFNFLKCRASLIVD
ncbi:sporulation protein Cse60 [Salinicoccus roseus]|uniref:sporulation protein Cse60 n=1 Tax=Salinicoccus roseus TaxID=45670 RepID=UPI001EF59727|nr:sporulation protein Cse60 [Salinicoccus roseus]